MIDIPFSSVGTIPGGFAGGTHPAWLGRGIS